MIHLHVTPHSTAFSQVTKMSGEGGQFGSLIHFLKTLQINAEGSHGRKFTFEAFFAATLAETPLGYLPHALPPPLP